MNHFMTAIAIFDPPRIKEIQINSTDGWDGMPLMKTKYVLSAAAQNSK